MRAVRLALWPIVGAALLLVVVKTRGCEPPEIDRAALKTRSAPLVAALTQYTSDHGQPPERLDQLVPKYLAAIPQTGIPEHPAFDYGTFPTLPDYPWQLYAHYGGARERTLWCNARTDGWCGPDDPSGW